MRALGWLSVNRVTAASGSRKQGGGKKRRTEKVTWVETKSIATPRGEQQVRPIAEGGRIELGGDDRDR